MKVYRVIKLDKTKRLAGDEGIGAFPRSVRIRHEITHKMKWKPPKMLRKIWDFWL